MSRFPFALTFAVILAPVIAPAIAHAQSQAELAEKLNEEGKELMYQNKYAEASYKFQQAVARVAEPKYFFNLCVSQTNEGRLQEAYANCISAKGNATSEIVGKADKMIAKIQDTAKQQNVELQEPGGAAGRDPTPTPSGNPPPVNNGNPPPGDLHNPPPPRVGTAEPPPTAGGVRYARYQPPPENLALGRGPDNNYTWTLGIDFLGGGGQIGQKDFYGTAAVGFRVKSDVLFDPIHRIGAEGYIQYNHLGQGSQQQQDGVLVDTLDVVDVGAALYKHFCLGGRLCVTPLLGLHLSLMSPAGQQDSEGSQLFNYAAVGGRGEIALSYAFGPRYEHVFSVAGGVNVYSKVLSGPSGADDQLTIAEAGLDRAGAIGYLAIGYTYRFNTPLGVAPFITLE
jgi:hypothetical protein